MFSIQFKIALALCCIFVIYIANPLRLLFVWIVTSPVISNFIDRPIHYSLFSSKKFWNYADSATEGFVIRDLFQYDRIILGLLFFTILLSKRYVRFKAHKIDLYFFLLLIALFVSSLYSHNIIHSIRTIIDTFGMYYIAYFIGRHLIQENDQFDNIIKSAILLGVILVMIGLYEWQVLAPDILHRITGPFQFWETMGSTLAILGFIILFKISTLPSDYLLTKKILLIIFILTLFCVFLTQTRTSLAAIVLGVIVAAYKGRHLVGKHIYKKVLVFSFILLIVSAFNPLIILNTVFVKHTLERDTGDSRKEQYVVAYRMFTSNPLIGIGFKNYKDEFDSYTKADEFEWSRAGVTTLHNSYSVIAVESGLMGFIPMLLLFFTIFKTCNQYFIMAQNKYDKYWGLTFISISTAYFLSALTFDMFFIPTIDNKLYYLCLGITIAKYQNLSDRIMTQ